MLDARKTRTEKAKLIAPDPGPLVALWRRRQLEYTRLRALMERFEDFVNLNGARTRPVDPERSAAESKG